MITTPAWITLAVLIIAAVLLISEKLRPDLVALMVLVVLGLSGIVTLGETFSGFSSSAVMTLLGISIISEGLHQSGATQRLGKLIYWLGSRSEGWLVLATLLVSAGLSLFMNNIAAVGVLLPAVLAVARRSQVPESRLLMPLAFGTSLGGMATLLTTSNIIVSGTLRDAGYAPFGLLDFLPVGGPVALVGIVYMMLIGRRLMPKPHGAATGLPRQLQRWLSSQYALDRTLIEVEILPGSIMAGRSIAESDWRTEPGINILGVTRGKKMFLAPSENEIILEGDVLLSQGYVALDAQESLKLKVRHWQGDTPPLANDRTVLAEVVISPHSGLIGHTLSELHFRQKYGLNVIGIWRENHPITLDLAEHSLKFGDALLVQGEGAQVRLLENEPDLIVLEHDPDAVIRPHKTGLALAITFITLGIAAFDILPVSEVAMAGAVIMILAGCLEMNDVYRAVEWKAIFLIAGMWPLSVAIRSTGLADALIHAIQSGLGTLTPLATAGVLIVVGMTLTQVMSGQVSAIVLAPLAIAAAKSLNTDPRALGMAVALACSISFLTPYGHPVNIMVMGPGNYRFRDFLRVGGPLALVSIAVILLMLSGWI